MKEEEEERLCLNVLEFPPFLINCQQIDAYFWYQLKKNFSFYNGLALFSGFQYQGG